MDIQYNTNIISLNRNDNYNLNDDKTKKETNICFNACRAMLSL